MTTTEIIDLLDEERKKAKENGNERLVRAYNYVIRFLNRQRTIDKLCDLKGAANESEIDQF